MTPTELQQAAAACGCIYQGEGMGLHHFIERESGGNFSMVVPFPSLVFEKAADVRQRFGLPSLAMSLLAKVVSAYRNKVEDGPGHNHRIKGQWDDTGKPCEWCRTWQQILALVNTLPVANATHVTTQSGTA